MHGARGNSSALGKTSFTMPFLSTSEMEALASPPPRAGSLRGKLNALHHRTERRYDTPIKPSEPRRRSLASAYKQKQRRSVAAAASTTQIGNVATSPPSDNEVGSSPEKRAKEQLASQRRRRAGGGDDTGAGRPNKRGNSNNSNNGKNNKAQKNDSSMRSTVDARQNLSAPDSERKGDATPLPSEQSDSPNPASASGANAPRARQERPDYTSSEDSSFSDYALSDDSLEGDVRHDYETRMLLSRPFRSASPLGTGEKANFFQQYRHMSRRNEQGAETMRTGYLSSLISGGLPPEPMHVVGGPVLDSHHVAEQYFTDDNDMIIADGMTVSRGAATLSASVSPIHGSLEQNATLSALSSASSPGVDASDGDGIRFASLHPLPATTIDLSGRGMGDSYASAIGGSVKYGGSGSCSLLMGSNRLSPRGAGSLLAKLAASNFQSILHLDLSGNNIGAKGVRALVEGVTRAPGSKGAMHLRHLNIAKNNLGDAVLAQLVEGLASVPIFRRTLKTLVADSNGAAVATCENVELLLQDDHTLSTLSLAWNRIGSNGGAALIAGGLFENIGLAVLNLAWNCLGSSGDFMALGEAISRHERLVHVNLAHNQIGALDIEVFADDMERNHTILGIHLAGNRASVNRMGFIERGEEPPKLNFTTDSEGGRTAGAAGAAPQRRKRGRIERKQGGLSSSSTLGGNRSPTKSSRKTKKTIKKKKLRRRKRTRRDLVMDQQKMVTRSVLHALFMLWMESGVKPADIFGKMDADGSGTVNKSEFRKALKKFGYNVSAKDANTVFRALDCDDSGDISYQEISLGIKAAGRHPPPMRTVLTMHDGSGGGKMGTKRTESEDSGGRTTAPAAASEDTDSRGHDFRKIDHVHTAHLSDGVGLASGRAASTAADNSDNSTITSANGPKTGVSENILGPDGICSNCWICCGFQEEQFVYDVPRGSPDEALEAVAVCFGFEGFIPRETQKEDTRTVNKGGVRFVARIMVPPGDVRYYFLIGGVAHHNPDEPSMPLDIKFLVKKRRPIGNRSSSWSRVASKYTSRPRCNVRSVPRRVGYLMTSCLPRPTGFDWKEDALFEEEEEEEEEENKRGEDSVGGVTSGGEIDDGQRVLAKISVHNARTTVASESPRIESSSWQSGSALGVDKTCDLIAHIWTARSNSLSGASSSCTTGLGHFTASHFLQKFGEDLGIKRLEMFRHAVKSYCRKSKRVEWFGVLAGWVDGGSLDLPPEGAALDGSLAYAHVLSALLSGLSMEERLRNRPCLVDCGVLCGLLEQGAAGITSVDDDAVSAWDDQGGSASTPDPLFDEHFCASKRYQRLVGDICAIRISKGLGTTLVDVDAALDKIMHAWYEWRLAPETIDARLEDNEYSHQWSRVPATTLGMIREKGKGLFAVRNSLRWGEEEVESALRAGFEADWARAEVMLLGVVGETWRAGKEEAPPSKHGETAQSATHDEAEEMRTLRGLFGYFYRELSNVFELYAAADGSPYELGREGVTQMCRDLCLFDVWEMIREAGAKDSLEKVKSDDAGPDGGMVARIRPDGGIGGSLLTAMKHHAGGSAKEKKEASSTVTDPWSQRPADSDRPDSSSGPSPLHPPAIVRQACTSESDLHALFEQVCRDAGALPEEGLRKHHFFGLVSRLAALRYGAASGRRSLSVSVRYFLTWEVCRGQIDYSPHQFRLEVLYAGDVVALLGTFGAELQETFVRRAVAAVQCDDYSVPPFCDPCTMYLTYRAWREMLQECGLTAFAGVSERHVRMAFIASQGHMLEEPLTHPPGLLMDEFCEAVARVAYSMLLTSEERAARNKQRLRWVGLRRKSGGSGDGSAQVADATGSGNREDVVITKERMVSALTNTIRIVCGIEQVGDRS